jgi:hypothetical protein
LHHIWFLLVFVITLYQAQNLYKERRRMTARLRSSCDRFLSWCGILKYCTWRHCRKSRSVRTFSFEHGISSSSSVAVVPKGSLIVSHTGGFLIYLDTC